MTATSTGPSASSDGMGVPPDLDTLFDAELAAPAESVAAPHAAEASSAATTDYFATPAS